jgi:elongation factor G
MSASLDNKRNIAILAHVNAGKTTVSERLLYFSSAISGTGEVDEGLATMDYLEEEKKRGITIEAGLASYSWKGVRVTFVDTPGHVDFGAEVDFALRAVEGAVLVVSGVSGVESQTLAAWEKIKRNGNSPLIFVNKMDVTGADSARVLTQIGVLFKTTPVVLNFPVYKNGLIDGVIDVVNELALFRSEENPRRLLKGEIPEHCYDEYIQHRHALIDFASRHNDEVLTKWMDGRTIEAGDIVEGVRAGAARGEGVPVCMGSAIRNAGMRQLLNAINQLLPSPGIPEDAKKSVGFIIKTRWYPGLGKIYLAKIFSGTAALALKDARFHRVFAETLEPIDDPGDGDLVAVETTRALVAGMHLGRGAARDAGGYRPLLEARLESVGGSDHERLGAVLKGLADADPSIHIEADTTTGGWLVRTVGELQLDVFCRRLTSEHGCEVRTGAPRVHHVEKLKTPMVKGRGHAQAFGSEAFVTFTATRSLKSEKNQIKIPKTADPAEAGVLRDCFLAFCTQGVWGQGEIEGLDLEVTEIGGAIRPVPLVLLAKTFADGLRETLKNVDFEVFEPIMNLEIIVPEAFCGAVLADLAARGGVIKKIDADGRNSIIFLEIPLENVFGYATLLRSLSKGLGVFVLTYERYGVKKRI